MCRTGVFVYVDDVDAWIDWTALNLDFYFMNNWSNEGMVGVAVFAGVTKYIPPWDPGSEC